VDTTFFVSMSLTSFSDFQLHQLADQLADQYRLTEDSSVDDRLMKVFREMSRREHAIDDHSMQAFFDTSYREQVAEIPVIDWL
jgi:polyhydroxyalkanoate synthesis regulator protein